MAKSVIMDDNGVFLGLEDGGRLRGSHHCYGGGDVMTACIVMGKI